MSHRKGKRNIFEWRRLWNRERKRRNTSIDACMQLGIVYLKEKYFFEWKQEKNVDLSPHRDLVAQLCKRKTVSKLSKNFSFERLPYAAYNAPKDYEENEFRTLSRREISQLMWSDSGSQQQQQSQRRTLHTNRFFFFNRFLFITLQPFSILLRDGKAKSWKHSCAL